MSWGKMSAGMNWTAWNSVRANALTASPSAIPRSAFPIASSADEPGAVSGVRPSARNPTVQTTIAWIAASRPNAMP